ncbi:MAG: PAS domain-containing sensor histidine kinase [Pseudomonadota bacterium]
MFGVIDVLTDLRFAAGMGVGAIATSVAHRMLFCAWRNASTCPALADDVTSMHKDRAILEMIVRHANDGIVVQSIDGRIEWSNPAYSRISGFGPEEIRGRKPQEFILPDDLKPDDAEIEAFRYDIASGMLDSYEVARNVRKSGEEFWNQLSFAVVESSDGEVKVIVICRDVTDEQKMFAELKQHRDHLEELVHDRTALIERQASELEEALEQEKHLSALQRSFVSMASHEFRTPLAIIDGNAQRMQRRLAKMSPEDVAARIKKMRVAVRRMMSLIESTLSAAKMEAGKIRISPKAIDIRAILVDCCEQQQELTPTHRIGIDDRDLPDSMIADPGSVTQILTNLLSNAAKYSPDADQVDIKGRQDGGEVVIAVRDYGLGIDPDEQDKVFTRFFRARTSVGIPGTGIGLNLSHMLAAEHGGSLTFDSIKGEGTTFTLRLPAVARQSDELDAAEKTAVAVAS